MGLGAMTDVFSAEKRSEIMRAIRGRDMKPERLLRSALHKLGYRFRLSVARLPGKPDLVFPARRKVIFVHGCFWHQHGRCIDGRRPKSNTEYWRPKLERNVERDRENRKALRRLGWRVLVVWECEILRALPRALNRARKFLES